MTKEQKTAQQLLSDGIDQFNSGDYEQSIEAFKNLKDWYPFSKYTILAELKIADAYYNLEEYDDAISAYEDFENLHPRNEAVPYVIYQIGLCYFKRIDTIDRDQVTAKKALETFYRLTKQFSGTPYAKRAESKIEKCLKSLAGHEFYVGLFYYKSKHYKAALGRFKTVVVKYPDVGVQQKALKYITKCESLIKKKQKE